MLNWKQKVRQLKKETYALYFAYKDPRTAWYARLLAICVVAYAFSPLDLIPDFIPILGQLDDLILVPLGILAVRALIPALVMAECREKAQSLLASGKPTNYVAATVIVIIWLLLAVFSIIILAKLFS